MLNRLRRLEYIDAQIWKRTPLRPIHTHEPLLTQAIQRLVLPGWHCADVGAHLGTFAASLAELVGPTGRVVAFEAFPHNAAILRARLGRSDYRERLVVEGLAVVERSTDSVPLFPGRLSSHKRGLSRRTPRRAEWNVMGRDVSGRATDPMLSVRGVSLDDYFGDARLDFVKIDVEGAEARVLRGMTRLLTTTRPFLAIEFHSDQAWLSHKALMDYGYELQTPAGSQIVPGSQHPPTHCLAIPSRRFS